MVWNDEFNGTGVDLDKWRFQTGTGSQYGLTDWGNNEGEFYKEDNAEVKDGKLVITAKKENESGKSYTSSRLYTGETYAKKYGKIEARMKLPEGQGFWPAFWMMPKDSAYGVWASSGELDIMEAVGQEPGAVNGTIHYGQPWPANKYAGGTYHFPEGSSIGQFHTYSIEWEPGEIRWYVDDQLYSTKSNWDSTGAGQPAKYAFPAPYDQDFYIILNLAVGGNYVGNKLPSDDLLPSAMEVDYVRVYELTGRPYRTVTEPVVLTEPLPEDAKLPTSDGNYLYDNDYSKGFNTVTTTPDPLNTYDLTDPSRWNLVTMDTFGGVAQANVEQVGAESHPFAKISVQNGGSQPYSIQMIQNFTAGKGRYYKLSYDAKAAANRGMSIKIGGGPSRGYSGYYTVDTTLTPDLKSYEYVFQMAADTDKLARLEFNLGQNNNTVWIGNVKIEEIPPVDPYKLDDPKAPLADGNHIYNGTFDLGTIDRMTYWDFTAPAGKASASVDPVARQLNLNFASDAASADEAVISQRGLRLLPNNDYHLTFDAKAAAPRSLIVQVTDKDGAVFSEKSFDLTTAMTAYTFDFKMSADSTNEGKVVFRATAAGGNLTLDNVAMINTTKADWVEVGDNLVTNGTFDSSLTGWNYYNNEGGASAAFSNEGGKAKAVVTNPSSIWWHIQFYQGPISVPTGKYKFQFDMSSSEPRTAYFELTGKNGAANVPMQKVSLDPSTKTYSFLLDVPAGDYQITFGLGKDAGDTVVPSTVFLDNIKLVEVSQNAVVDGSFDSTTSLGTPPDNEKLWNQYSQSQYEQWAGKANIAIEDGVAVANVLQPGWDWWQIQLYQLNLALNPGTYKIQFDMKSEQNRPVYVELTDSGAPKQKFDVDGTMKTYSAYVDVTKSGSFKFMFGLGRLADDPTPAVPYKIYVDNVKVAKAPHPPSNLLNAPELIPDAAGNQVGQDIEIAYTDQAGWSSKIQSVLINGTAAAYTVEAGKIILPKEAFPYAMTYAIVIHANGYKEAKLTQKVYGSDGNLVLNGGMAASSPDWVKWQGDGGSADVTYDGKANISIAAKGPNNWSIQYYQEGIPLVPGKTYEVTFKAASTIARPVDVEYDVGAALGQFALTPAEQTFKATFKASKTAAKLNFLLGNVAGVATPTDSHTITISEVTLKEAGPSVPVPLGNILYLIVGDGAETVLSSAPGIAESSLAISSAGGEAYLEPHLAAVFTADVTSAVYKENEKTSYRLYFDTTTPIGGTGLLVRVSYDFDGDGTWDRIEQSPLYALDPVSGWEAFTEADRGDIIVTGSDYRNFVNGKIKIELWNQIGSGDTKLKVNAPTDSSRLILPYAF